MLRMRRFGSLVSLCALLTAQTPFTPCPAGIVTREPAAPTVEAGGVHEHHHATPPSATAHAVDNAVADAADLTVPRPAGHRGSCTMLARCDWVAVAAEAATSEPGRGCASGYVAALAGAPMAADPFSSTPPPRPVS